MQQLFGYQKGDYRRYKGQVEDKKEADRVGGTGGIFRFNWNLSISQGLSEFVGMAV